jgi:hypothetical protein
MLARADAAGLLFLRNAIPAGRPGSLVRCVPGRSQVPESKGKTG